MNLPRLYAPVKIKFWSLRTGLGQNLGVIFDMDTEVEQLCRRILCPGGWKWQLVHYWRDVEWDLGMDQDKQMVDP